MRFKDLTRTDKDVIERMYLSKDNKADIQSRLSSMFNTTPRTIRKWAKKLGLNVMTKNIVRPSNIMVYDIETCRATAKLFWTGKQYVSYRQIKEEPRIITIAWKWLGQDDVHSLTWDDEQSDEEMVKEFLKSYNRADMVIGFNNDNFDNRWINARAMKYGFEVDTHIKSMDLMKQEKRLFRMIGYSMDYSSLFAKVERKQSHEGILMWDMVEEGSKEQQAEYMSKMLEYNIGDIVTTEELYLRLVPYLRHKVHFGVMNGEEKWTCPNTGSKDVQLHKTTVTPAGTIQRIMKSPDGSTYRISNKQYMNFLDYKIRNTSNEGDLD